MYQLLISEEARLDILDTFSWYESRLPGLGHGFEKCLDDGFRRILQRPLIYQKRYKGVRVHFIERFPYGIHYLIDGKDLRVFGVFHTSRNPGEWKIRLKA
ncbi:MAG: type II toxin-antitoxin system RelE/ParE family toxin [Mucilaginibacter sp.]